MTCPEGSGRERVRATISEEALAGYDKKLSDKLAKVSGRIAAVDEAAKEIQADGEDDAPGSAGSLTKAPAGDKDKKTTKPRTKKTKGSKTVKSTRSTKSARSSTTRFGSTSPRTSGRKASK